MKTHKGGREYLSDIFYTAGDMNLEHLHNDFGVLTGDPHDIEIREKRLQREHQREEEERQEELYPNCKLSDRPIDAGVAKEE